MVIKSILSIVWLVIGNKMGIILKNENNLII